jgi:hypothetical protein
MGMTQQSPNSYAGLFPIVEEVGFTVPLFLAGTEEAASGFSTLALEDSKLTYSLEDNSFASIVIPGEVGGDPLTLMFGNQTEVVQPGATFEFLPSFPDVVSLTLAGTGLSESSAPGFTFTHEGLADLTLVVGAIPEPSSAVLLTIGAAFGIWRGRRGE